MRFIGDYTAKTDSKGRVFLPAAFRKALEAEGVTRLVLRKDLFQPCLVLYPESVWNAQLDDLKQKLNAYTRNHQMVMRQFVADASHELKTPLAVIMASADALESSPTDTKWLNNIKSESDRMNKLIADLLELAKSEEVNDQTEFTVGNLSKTVEMSVLTFEGVLFEKGVLLEDSIEENIELNMNSYKIQQLMSILLDNAVKHSNSGGVVSVSLKKDKDITLTVTNQGEGIPQGEEEKIFERFYRADESRNRNENRYGLGLAIAKNICLSHSAEISAKSENGSTTFKVVFKQ